MGVEDFVHCYNLTGLECPIMFQFPDLLICFYPHVIPKSRVPYYCYYSSSERPRSSKIAHNSIRHDTINNTLKLNKFIKAGFFGIAKLIFGVKNPRVFNH